MSLNIYAVILAGGSGTRFWPKSRLKSPKQLCKLGGSDKTMLEITLDRLDGFIPPKNRIIVTHKDQAASTRQIVGDRCATIIAEPEARNTANALAVAALEVKQLNNNQDAIMVSLHADHVVANVPKMLASFETAISISEKLNLLTLIGIVPAYAETGYGYIERGDKLAEDNSFKVSSFREKPELKIAEQYVKSKNFLWNAGLFVFPVNLFLSELGEKLPRTIEALTNLLKTAGGKGFAAVHPDQFSKAYSSLPKISVDHAVLEVSKSVGVVEADIGWQDVGSWDALNQSFKCDEHGNFIEGPNLVLETKNCTIDSDGPLIATLGVDSLVVVYSKGAVLVCPKHRSQDVKQIVDRLREINRLDLI